MNKADKLLIEWEKFSLYISDFDNYDDECWKDADTFQEYGKELTTLMKDTIKYVENLAEKENNDI